MFVAKPELKLADLGDYVRLPLSPVAARILVQELGEPQVRKPRYSAWYGTWDGITFGLMWPDDDGVYVHVGLGRANDLSDKIFVLSLTETFLWAEGTRGT